MCRNKLKTLFIVLMYSATGSCGSDKDRNSESEKILFPNDFSLVGVPRTSSFNHNHEHPHHHRDLPPNFQHDPQFHKDNPYSYSTSIDEGSRSTADHDVDDKDNNTTNYIPLEFIKNINTHEVSDLLLNYIEDDEVDTPNIASRFGAGIERSAGKIPKAAGCSPENTTITLKKSTDPSILYIPECTKIERCGGCCSHTLLSCQPSQVEMVAYKVFKTQYNGAKKLKLVGKETVLVERHINCSCDCRVKAENCNKYQEYRPSECQCVCTNTDAQKKCYKNHHKKLWNPEICACQCRDIFQCSTGQYFDDDECKCMSMPVRRRYAP